MSTTRLFIARPYSVEGYEAPRPVLCTKQDLFFADDEDEIPTLKQNRGQVLDVRRGNGWDDHWETGVTMWLRDGTPVEVVGVCPPCPENFNPPEVQAARAAAEKFNEALASARLMKRHDGFFDEVGQMTYDQWWESEDGTFLQEYRHWEDGPPAPKDPEALAESTRQNLWWWENAEFSMPLLKKWLEDWAPTEV